MKIIRDLAITSMESSKLYLLTDSPQIDLETLETVSRLTTGTTRPRISNLNTISPNMVFLILRNHLRKKNLSLPIFWNPCQTRSRTLGTRSVRTFASSGKILVLYHLKLLKSSSDPKKKSIGILTLVKVRMLLKLSDSLISWETAKVLAKKFSPTLYTKASSKTTRGTVSAA